MSIRPGYRTLWLAALGLAVAGFAVVGRTHASTKIFGIVLIPVAAALIYQYVTGCVTANGIRVTKSGGIFALSGGSCDQADLRAIVVVRTQSYRGGAFSTTYDFRTKDDKTAFQCSANLWSRSSLDKLAAYCRVPILPAADYEQRPASQTIEPANQADSQRL